MAAKAKSDPFADAEDVKTETPDVEVAIEETETGVEYSITLKGGRDFDASWVVMRGTKQQLLEEFDEDLQDLLKNAAKYGKAFGELSSAGKPAAKGTSAPARQTPGPKDHPDGKKEFCQHGEMDYKSGVTKSGKNQGKTWHAFDCSEGVCDRKWLND